MLFQSEEDIRILHMQRLCTDKESDSPTPLLSCAARYPNGASFSHTVGGERDISLCAESVRHTVLASVSVLLSAIGAWSLSTSISEILPQFPMKAVTLYDLLCGTLPIKIKSRLCDDSDIDALFRHIEICKEKTPICTYQIQDRLLTALIEHISDMPIDEICELALFAPLGMRSTFFLTGDREKIRLPYHVETNTEEDLNEAKGKLFSTADDLFILLSALSDAMHGKHTPVFTQKNASILFTPQKDSLYTPAFLMRGDIRNTPFFPDAASSTSFLSLRESNAFLFCDLTYGVSFAVLSENTLLSRDRNTVARLGNVFLNAENEKI